MTLKPSKRNELEITDLNNLYLKDGLVEVITLPQSVHWLDAGTHDSLLKAGVEVNEAEKKNHRKVACIEETAYKNGWITKEHLLIRADRMKNQYGDYLRKIAN